MADDFKNWGVQQIFIPSNNFDPMLEHASPLYVDDIIHKVVLDVDEQGTVAAAVTANVGFGASRGPRGAFNMRCDRPFHVFLVYAPYKLVTLRGLYNGGAL
jgi:serpin B